MERESPGARAEPFDVAIVGGGVSGTALLYALVRYTNLRRIVLIEKHEECGQVNSRSNNNSQTLHVGDIETNYSIEKVREVKAGASMVVEYAMRLPVEENKRILFPMQKMVFAVGEREVEFLSKRFSALKEIFPNVRKLDRGEIEKVEPNIIRGRAQHENVLALVNHGHAVDYGMLARSLAARAKDEARERTEIILGAAVKNIRRAEDHVWELDIIRRDGASPHSIRARAVVFDADAYSLLFAKRLRYGHEFSLIPVAGTFFFSRELLRGKVYTVQDPRLPFAAVHGDPDVRVPDATRWGPTARFVPVLEARNWASMLDYFRVSGLAKPKTWLSFIIILLDPLRAWYLIRNIFYEIPLLGKYYFARQVRKIVPTARGRDFTRARGFGGMRLQRVNTNTHELLLGEGKIIGERIIFNMTPSPGASVCLYNAMRDCNIVTQFFGSEFSFDKKKMEAELCEGRSVPLEDPSQKSSYVS
ncbi:MAG: Malate dehydrogenase (Acceptor) [Parcubacteria group bacterium GW2011_GWA2_51_10]|nr:MAG: Malate dehydrogenase (Acceptor) [Parcubacteria group bacterium GW2011_GWA2_51_10]